MHKQDICTNFIFDKDSALTPSVWPKVEANRKKQKASMNCHCLISKRRKKVLQAYREEYTGKRMQIQSVGMQIKAISWEIMQTFLKEIKNGSAIWSSDTTSRYLSEEYEHINLEGYFHLYIYSSMFITAQASNQIKLQFLDN